MKLHDRTDDRAVSELLGGMFVFALLLAVVVLAQVALVPTLNQQVEYEHSLRTQSDLQDLQSAVSRAVNAGGSETVPVELGVTYPSRFLLLNPPPVAGSLRAGDPLADGIVITNVTVPGAPETDEFWTNPNSTAGAYESRILRYAADYNELRRNADTILEGNVMFERHDTADVVASRSGLVDGRQINIVALAGDPSISQTRDLSVDVAAASGPARTVTVTDDGTPINVSVGTLLSEAEWRERLDPEPHVAGIGYDDPDGDPETPNVLTVTLEAERTYTLRMAKVGIGGGVDRAAAAYLTRAPGRSATVPVNGGEVPVDVRDAFNNPVAGTEVTFRLTQVSGGTATLSWGGDSVTGTGNELVVRSDAEGAAVPVLSGTASSVRIRATIQGGTENYERVTFGVEIGAGGGGDDSDGSDEINPYGDGFVSLEGAVTLDDAGKDYTKKTDECGGSDCRVVLTLNNNVGQPVGIESVRINAYNLDSKDNGKKDVPAKFDVVGTSSDIGVMGRNPDYLTGVSIPANGDDYQLALRILNEDGDPLRVSDKDTFFVTIIYDGAPKATYFVTF